MWQVQDTTGSLPFNGMRLNPIPGLNTAIYGLEDANNVLLGFNGEVRPFKQLAAYGQLAIDKVQNTKWAYQVGLKAFFWKLNARLEYNHADPFMYRSNPVLQNHSHYNESLAHPVGAYFDEMLVQLNFRHKRWFSRIQLNSINYGDFGNNIFDLPSAITGTSNRYNVQVISMQGGWIINPVNRMGLFAGVLGRTEKVNNVNSETLFVHLGIRTNVRNLYYDF